jgi:S1-C subfamily serine protease
VVIRVEAKGPFGKAGVEPGDIILQINRKGLAGPDDFAEVLSTMPPQKKMILTVVDHRSREASLVQLTAP